MNRHQFESDAFECINGGLNCAESVLTAAVRGLDLGPQGLAPRIATCFGGGVGRTNGEMCGALAGALMALGLVHGRNDPSQSSDRAASLATELRQRFINAHGSSTCRELLAAFGPQENWAACKRLTASTAGLLFDLLQDPPAILTGEPAPAPQA